MAMDEAAKLFGDDVLAAMAHVEHLYDIRETLSGGIQKLYRFPNGYGASVIDDGYGSEAGRWELAVIKYTDDPNSEFILCYSTPITNDVLGWLFPNQVDDILSQIKAL